MTDNQDPVDLGEVLTEIVARQVETLTVDEMLPRNFTPLCQRRFLVKLMGIDAFLVKSALIPDWGCDGDTTFEVVLHEAVSPSARQQVWEYLKTQGPAGGFPAEVVWLDPVGTVVSKILYTGVRITRAVFSPVEYGSNDISEIALSLTYEGQELGF